MHAALPAARAGRAEVGVELVPGVAHRREAVAEVTAPGRRRRPTWRRSGWLEMTRSNGIEVELLDGGGKERQVVPVAPPTRGAAAGRTRCAIRRRSMAGDTEPGTCTSVKSSRVGKALAEHLEHLLAAAHAGQPVVDERDSQAARGGRLVRKRSATRPPRRRSRARAAPTVSHENWRGPRQPACAAGRARSAVVGRARARCRRRSPADRRDRPAPPRRRRPPAATTRSR